MPHDYTTSFATLTVSTPAFEEIAALLKAASYNHCIKEDGQLIVMTGIALVPNKNASNMAFKVKPAKPK